MTVLCCPLPLCQDCKIIISIDKHQRDSMPLTLLLLLLFYLKIAFGYVALACTEIYLPVSAF